MSDSDSGKLDEMASRIKDVVASAESQLDADGLLHRLREAVARAGGNVDTDAIMGKFHLVAGHAEGKIDPSKLREWVTEIDRDKLRAWLAEAQHRGAGAVSVIETQGEMLAARVPGAIDKLAGVAKERLGLLARDEGLIGEGQVDRLKGQLNETIASVAEMAENRSHGVAEAIKTKLGDEGRRADR